MEKGWDIYASPTPTNNIIQRWDSNSKGQGVHSTNVLKTKKPRRYIVYQKKRLHIYLYIVIKDRDQTCFMSFKFSDNDFVFLQGYTESDLGDTIWIGYIVPNTVFDKFQKQPLQVSDKRIKLDIIRLDARYIALTIQWYDQITGIYVSDIVYRLYCDNTPKVRSHTQLFHGKYQ